MKREPSRTRVRSTRDPAMSQSAAADNADGDELVPQALCPVREWPLPVGRVREPGEEPLGGGGDGAPRADRTAPRSDPNGPVERPT
jgi:hypothetical protein